MSASGTPRGFTPFVDDVWLASNPVSILGMKLTATMTVVRLRVPSCSCTHPWR